MPDTVIGDSHSATGLARPDALDWLKELTEDVNVHRPDAVVLLVGGNDAQNLRTGDGWVQISDFDAWKADYRRRVDQVLDIDSGHGESLWWIGLPVMRIADLDRVGPVINSIIQDEVTKRDPRAHYVNPDSVLTAPDGGFQSFVKAPGGLQTKIRENDGVHVTRIGADWVVGLFLPDLISTYTLQPAPSTASTTPPPR